MNYSDTVLLIVDVQRFYSNNFNMGYINRINTYIDERDYKEIRTMIDLFEYNYDSDCIPLSISKKCTHPIIFKQYSYKFPMYYIIENNINYNYEKLDKLQSKIFYIDSGAIIFYCNDKDKVVMQHITNDFLNTILKWKDDNKTVHLVGGDINRCVDITKTILDCFSIKCEIIDSLCYSISENIYVPKFINKIFPNINSNIKWKKIKNTDMILKEYIKNNIDNTF